MRSSLRRAPAGPPGGGPPRNRAFRPMLPLGLLGAVALALFALDGFGVEIFPAWRELVGPGGFTLCRNGHRQNCVIDGDTIRHNGTVIRIAGIDAPETRHPECERERELGKQATNRLLELINAGPFEIVHKGGRDADKYGRKLRVLERGGRSLGDVLVAERLARRWDGAHRSWCH